MSEVKPNSTWEKVTSVGDAWIMCKSKSHRGHVYYFNTLTGETAWNLSDIEIQKARKFTKTLENRPGAKPMKCPEPNSPPTTLPRTNLASSSEQRENIKRHLIPPFLDQHIAGPVFPNRYNPSAHCNTLPQISNLTALNTLNNLGPPNITSLGYTPNLNLYNPNVWDVSKTQQVFITPSLVQLAIEEPPNIAFNNRPPQLPQSSVFSEYKPMPQEGSKNFFPKNRYNLNRQGNKPYNTLRKDLKRKIDEKSNNPEVLHKSRQQHVSIKFPNKAVETKSYYHNEDVIMNHRYAQTHEESSKLDLGPLIELVPSDANVDMWFVVVDLNVILTEFQFLNNMTDSDDKCHLMIPRHVMSQLNEYVTVCKDIKARRVLRFLSQQIEVGYSLIAETPLNVENDNAKIIIETCIEQIRNKYFLVLITDDDELLNNKDSTNIKMFSVIELKNLLKQPLTNTQTSIPKPMPLVLEKIKIVVPNNIHKPNSESNVVERNSFDEITRKLEVNTNVLNTKISVDKDIMKKSDVESKVAKKTLDAGIQTDFGLYDKDVVNGDTAADNVSSKTNNVVASPTKLLTFTKPNEYFKKREIKLKRSISNQPSGSTEDQKCTKKRSFKWRRRINTVSNTGKDNDNLSKLKDSHPEHKIELSNKGVSCDFQNKPPEFILNSTHASTGSSDVSVLRTVDNLSTANVIIEESSTSGIISNSAIDDTEYSINCKTQKPKDTRQFIQDVNSINSDDMSESWTVKCDEWISRFVQIMEEVLTLVLHQDPPFTHKSLPPPWNLHEAAQCITVKFNSHFTVKNAADKFSKVIFNVSDAKGKIMINMTLYQYMQMYSCGVYLLATLKPVTNNCEDIQIAVESLKTLLEDLKNSDLDSSSNEIFDNPQEYSVSPRVTPETSQDVDDCTREKQKIDDIATAAEQIPSHTPDNDKPSLDTVKFIRNIDINTFFDSLSLKRVTKDNKKTDNSSEDPQETSQQEGVKSTSEAVNVIKPKIIRNFSVCPDFENKLKSKLNRPLFEEHDNDLDYDEDYGDGSEECNIDDNYTDGNEGYDYIDSEVNYDTESQEMPVDPVLDDDDSNKIRFMTHALFNEVKEALFDVKMLCDFCYEEIDNPRQSVPQRFELINMARTAHTNLVKLCESLESMSEQQERSPIPNITGLLKEADSSISHIDDQLLLDFRLIVAECKKHTSVFIVSIQNIISALTT